MGFGACGCGGNGGGRASSMLAAPGVESLQAFEPVSPMGAPAEMSSYGMLSRAAVPTRSDGNDVWWYLLGAALVMWVLVRMGNRRGRR